MNGPTDGLFVVLTTLFGGERRSEQVEVPVHVRVDDIVLMVAIPEVGRGGDPTGKFIGTTLRLRRAGEINVLETSEEIVHKILRALSPQLKPTGGDPT